MMNLPLGITIIDRPFNYSKGLILIPHKCPESFIFCVLRAYNPSPVVGIGVLLEIHDFRNEI